MQSTMKGWMASVGALACLALGAHAQQWSDGFESYAPGSNMDGQGGWREWNCPSQSPGDSIVSTVISRTGSQALEIKDASDLVYEMNTVDTGEWVVRAYHYIFSSGPNQLMPTDEAWFIMLNQYTCSGIIRWSLQLKANRPSGVFEFSGGPNNGIGAPLVMDQWVEVRVEIDTDQDMAQVFYDGTALGAPFQWSNGAGGAPGNPTIEAIDLWAPTSGQNSKIYWDDVSIAPRDTDVTFYCTAKSPLVCGVPSIGAGGVSSATATSGFELFAGPARQNRSGLFIYSDAGAAAIPFQGGLLCVQPSPLRRSCSVSSGGTNPCNGEFRLDFNRFAQGLCPGNPAAFLKVPGTQVNAQSWGRDSVATGSFLSDGAEWVVGP